MPKPTSLFIVLILCIAGYYFLQSFHKTRYGLKRSSGYHTFLSSASAGVVLMIIALVIYAFSDWLCHRLGWSFSLGDFVLNGLFRCEANYANVTLFDVGTITLVLSLILPFMIYRNQENQYLNFLSEFSTDSESPEYTKLCFSSFKYGLPILFTMSDRKVYIGYVPEIHAKTFNDIHVIPIFSGYRDKDTLELVPVTPYQDIIHDVENDEEEELDLEAFAISLPIREIVHAHLHDFSYYERFKEKEKDLEYRYGASFRFNYNNDIQGYS